MCPPYISPTQQRHPYRFLPSCDIQQALGLQEDSNRCKKKPPLASPVEDNGAGLEWLGLRHGRTRSTNYHKVVGDYNPTPIQSFRGFAEGGRRKVQLSKRQSRLPHL